ncbi:putative metalloprotease CJM1_0395 family protein [Rugamonas sp.]|uniref:putative metalloprotease CJM1_0395 family protein n=1 Tax=Rugamonas sp. TaxID=1926287 RepID=UPI0025D36E26|nr:putative metalloprotease CJM1_0395 family protein [Rugamonas sp.]
MNISAIVSSPAVAVPATTSTVLARAQPVDGGKAVAGATAISGISATSLQLDAKALALISKLKARDTDVRQHEQAHLAAAGGLATSGPSYTYERGPNGVSYAIGGEVQIDTSPGRTPQETIARAHIIEAAALAPADPSGADRAVAVQAQQLEAQARAALAQDLAPATGPDAGSGGDASSASSASQASPTSSVSPTSSASQTPSAPAQTSAASSVNRAYGAQSAPAPTLDTYA